MADTERFLRPAGMRRQAEIARRRWRNMMIAAMSNKKFPPEQKAHLEKMREELNIPLAEAGAILEDYREKGGTIHFFGDRHQRLELLRDMITMMLVDGNLDARERKLLGRVAEKLDVTDAQLDGYIEECRQALAPDVAKGASSESSRLSQRVFRRLTQNNAHQQELVATFETLDSNGRKELEMQVLEELVEKRAPVRSDESARTIRHRHAYLEDQRVARLLLEAGEVKEEQLRPFREEQERLFQENGTAVSYLSEMVKAHVLDPRRVQALRYQVRKDHADGEPEPSWTRSTEGVDGHALTIAYERVTLDQTFRASHLRLRGHLDHGTTPLLREVFEELFEYHDDASRLIILDLGELTYMSSAGVGEILNARSTVLDRWGDIRFIRAGEGAMEILSLLGVDQVLRVCNTLDEALWSFVDLAVLRDH